MDKAGVQAALVAAGLERLTKDLDSLARPSIRLTVKRANEARLRVGASKLGGVPDLPPGVLWPEWKGLPQSFIAQIRLVDIHPYDTEGLLPASGMLWFFYDARQETFGDDPNDRGGWRVFYIGGDSLKLRRVPAPANLPETSRFQAGRIRFASEITLPQQPSLELANFDWSDEEQKKYEVLLSTFPNPADHAAMHHCMLGHPDTIQDDMRLQCQLISHGVTDVNDPQAKRLEPGANDWQLLLQVDSDASLNMRWADAGMLYYWVRKTDLQGQRFDRSWLVLQSD